MQTVEPRYLVKQHLWIKTTPVRCDLGTQTSSFGEELYKHSTFVEESNYASEDICALKQMKVQISIKSESIFLTFVFFSVLVSLFRGSWKFARDVKESVSSDRAGRKDSSWKLQSNQTRYTENIVKSSQVVQDSKTLIETCDSVHERVSFAFYNYSSTVNVCCHVGLRDYPITQEKPLTQTVFE